MALKLVWKGRAARELATIHDYIAETHDPQDASRVAAQLYAVARSVPEHPNVGRIVPEFNRSDVRERLQGRYRIVYLLSGEAVIILSIWHTARPMTDLETLLKG